MLVQTTSGAGCVEAAAWQAVDAALAPLRAPGDDLADRRPLPIEPAQITFADGTVLSLASPPRIGDDDADRERVEQLTAALGAHGTLVARPTGAPRTTLTVRDRDTVLVPRGYHTVSAPPGYAVHYLNVMAGPTRAWAVANDPDHEWTLQP